jgi:hypothetical protein
MTRNLERRDAQLEMLLSKLPPPPKIQPREYVEPFAQGIDPTELQLDKISRNAVPKTPNFKPRKVRSDVTPEMIAAHQNELRRPIELGGEKYRYHPVNINLLPDPQAVPDESAADEQEILRNSAALQAETRRFDEYMREYARLTSAELYIIGDARPQQIPLATEADFANIPLRQKRLELVAQENEKNRPLREERERLLADYEARRAQLPAIQADIARLEQLIGNSERDKARLELETERSIGDRDLNQRQFQDYLRDKAAIDNQNAAELKASTEEFNALNTGKIMIGKQEGESDEDYAQRLFDTGRTSYDEDMLAEYTRSATFDKGKTRLREVLNNAPLIESLLKSMSSPEIFQMNKIWPAVKQRWEDRYGINNTELGLGNIDEIRAFIDETDRVQVFSKPRQMLPRREVAPVLGNRPTAPPAVIKRGETNPYLMTPAQLNKFSPKYKAIKGRPLGAAKDGSNWLEKIDELEAEGIIAPWGQPLIGIGLMVDVRKPKIQQFGRVAFNPEKLDKENALVILTHEGRHIPGIRNMRVSDEFVDAIEGVLAGGAVSLKSLSIPEKARFDELISLSGMARKVPNTAGQTKHAIKQRFEIVFGEHNAGNDNPAIKSELKELAHKSRALKMISGTELQRFLKAVK